MEELVSFQVFPTSWKEGNLIDDLTCLDLGKKPWTMAFSAGMVLPPPSLPSATDSIWFGGLWFGGPQLHLHDEDAQLVAREMAYEQKVRQPQTHAASPCGSPTPADTCARSCC